MRRAAARGIVRVVVAAALVLVPGTVVAAPGGGSAPPGAVGSPAASAPVVRPPAVPALAAAPAAPAPAVPVPALPAAPADAVRDAQYWLDSTGIREAWNTTRGAGQRIAIIDTGVARDVPELSGAVVDGADFSGEGTRGGGPVGENADHGTLVASLAAGRGTGPGAGVIGAAPEAEILAISIGFGAGSDEQVAEAVTWAVDHGATVINMSLTRNTLEWPKSWDEAFLHAAENDVVVVAAAGNRGAGTTRVGAPATMPGVLTVAGVTRSGEASFSASSQGITIGVAAPSEQLVGVRPGGAHVSWQGTSGASPIVAGVVALVRAAHPGLDAANVVNRVLETARDAGPSGPDFSYGHGILDAAAAVSADVALVEENPLGDLADWVRVHRRAEAGLPALPRDRSGLPAPLPAPAPESPVGTWLPGLVQLRLTGLPWLASGVLLAAAIGFAAAAVAHFRGPRASD